MYDGDLLWQGIASRGAARHRYYTLGSGQMQAYVLVFPVNLQYIYTRWERRELRAGLGKNSLPTKRQPLPNVGIEAQHRVTVGALVD